MKQSIKNPGRLVHKIIYFRAGMGFLLMASLGACASLDVNATYRPPSQKTIPSSTTVNKPFEQAWADFVRNISQSFFVVNNLSKDSRLINISVGQSQAGKFIDCGSVSYNVNGEPWNFNPAKNDSFQASTGFRNKTTMRHQVRGSGGRMNIFVAPEGNKTVFEVNTSYALEMNQSGESVTRNLLGQVIDEQYLQKQYASFQFTTKQPDQQPLGNVNITCQATGVWEQLVLDLAR